MSAIYTPGDVLHDAFTLRRFDTGAATNADSTPTAALYKNGVVDGAVTVTVAAVSGQAGAYTFSCTIPGGYAVTDVLEVLAVATVNAVTDRAWFGPYRLDSLVASRMASGADVTLADGAITAAKIAADAITAAKIATGAIDADALAPDAVVEIAAGVPSPASIADAVWDEVLSGHTTIGTAGKALFDASGGSGGSVTVNILYTGEYEVRAEEQYPSGAVNLYVGATPRLFLTVRDTSGRRVDLTNSTVTVTLTDRTGAEVSAETGETDAPYGWAWGGVAYVDVPSGWTAAAIQGASITVTAVGVSTITAGPLPVTVLSL